jgi:hypothetical protein
VPLSYHWKDLVRLRSAGTGNMTGSDDVSTVGRFGIRDEAWSLVYVRVHFEGGSGTASVTVTVRDRDSDIDDYDSTLIVFTGRGTGTDINFPVPDCQLDRGQWSFDRTQELVFAWTNPQAGTMRWGIEVGLIPASKATLT